MLRSNHRVRVGDASIVGNVSHSGNSRIINNVQSDFAYVKHPLLPETHSEASLPIKADGRVIGVLDVYSRELNAFDQNDLIALQVITNQLAASIQNKQLSDNLRQSPPETSSTNQDIAQDAWTHSSKLTAGYEYDQLRVTSIQRALPPEILSQLQSGRAITLTSDKIGGEGAHPTLVVPLMMYNKMIGILAALALDNARLLEETQLRTEQIRLLQEITATAASTVNLTELIEAISQKVQQGFNILYCGMTLTDPNSKNVVLTTCAATQGATGADIIKANLLRSNHEILKQVTDSGQAVKIYNAINYPALRSVAGILKADSINTIVVIPVRSRGEVIGTLSLYESNPERKFEEDEMRLLDQIALQTAGGIEVARSFEQAIQRAERERQISEVITKMRESLDIDTVLRTAAREIRATLNLDEVKVQIGTS
jgi:GAF domain-containing protein